MADNDTRPRITSDPGVLGGKPVIAGTRISVQLILEKMGDGWTIDDLLDDYPQLTREQIVASLASGACSRQRACAVRPYVRRRRIDGN